MLLRSTWSFTCMGTITDPPLTSTGVGQAFSFISPLLRLRKSFPPSIPSATQQPPVTTPTLARCVPPTQNVAPARLLPQSRTHYKRHSKTNHRPRTSMRATLDPAGCCRLTPPRGPPIPSTLLVIALYTHARLECPRYWRPYPPWRSSGGVLQLGSP